MIKNSTAIWLCLLSLCACGQEGLDKASSKKTDSPIFTFVEQIPQFPGGDGGIILFLQQNIKYPEKERLHDIQGKVLTRFVVNEDGTVSDVVIVKGVSPGLDNEALRVVKMLPKFKPGTQQGKAVKVYFNLPIVFKLQDPKPAASDKQKAH